MTLCYQLAIAQDHRKVEVGRDLQRLSSPAQSRSQQIAEQITWGLVQLSFEYLQGQRHHNLLGQDVSVSGRAWNEKDFSYD